MKSSQSSAASLIKKDLKKAFPAVKFSVRSSSFAGGNAVDVGWIDGPTVDSVDDIVKKYQYGHFDSMNDMYEYSSVDKSIPQAKYVQTHRSYSDEVRERITNQVAKDFGITDVNDENQWQGVFGTWKDNAVYRNMHKMNF